jgi:hypothetical protein
MTSIPGHNSINYNGYAQQGSSSHLNYINPIITELSPDSLLPTLDILLDLHLQHNNPQ